MSGKCFQILDPLGYIMFVSLNNSPSRSECGSAGKAQTQHDLSFVRDFGPPSEERCVVNGK